MSALPRTAPAVLMFLALFAAGCRSAGPAEEALVQARLGTEATRAGLYREAYFRFERAVALDPGNARFLNDLAILSEALGRFEEAAAHYAHALELAPADKRIRENYEKLQAYLAPDRPPDPAR